MFGRETGTFWIINRLFKLETSSVRVGDMLLALETVRLRSLAEVDRLLGE